MYAFGWCRRSSLTLQQQNELHARVLILVSQRITVRCCGRQLKNALRRRSRLPDSLADHVFREYAALLLQLRSLHCLAGRTDGTAHAGGPASSTFGCRQLITFVLPLL